MTGHDTSCTSMAADNGQRYADPARQPLTSESIMQPLDSFKGQMEGVPRSKQMSFTTYDSRDSTPDPEYRRAWNEKEDFGTGDDTSADVDVVQGAAGRLPEEVYDRTLPWWRNGIRKRLLKNVEWETGVLAAMQERVRSPIFDTYFVYTSSLGTHTFFMITLPALIFSGYQDVARGLIMVLALGVYVSSFVKDLFCSPRPFAPPVTRLTIGSHHLEYGLPSTHSTNSVSIALYFFSLLRQLYTTPASAAVSISAALADPANVTAFSNVTATVAMDPANVQETMISSTTYHAVSGILLFYTFSIVYGRLYTGMHSFTDCAMGVLLGAGIWAVHMVCSEPFHAWIRDGGWLVPAVMVPLCLYLVHRHPQPVDDCPCFEDAIAFVSVVMGEVLSRWYMQHNGYGQTFFVSVMPGKAWATWMDVATWSSIGALKLVLGIVIIFAWRIFAKSLSHMVLPPVFRLLAQLFTLPHRRFYTPATDYTNVPPEKGLHPIPSVIDLAGMLEREDEGASTAHRGRAAAGAGAGVMKLRNGKGRLERAAGASTEKEKVGLWLEEAAGKQEDPAVVAHYDADVLTKVVVYCGIGLLACGCIPVLFEMLGWGMRDELSCLNHVGSCLRA